MNEESKMKKDAGEDSALDLLEEIRRGLQAKGVDPSTALKRAVVGDQETTTGGGSEEEEESSSEAEEVSSEEEDSEEESESEDDEEEDDDEEEESSEEDEEDDEDDDDDDEEDDEDGDEDSESDDSESEEAKAKAKAKVKKSEVRVKLTLDGEVRAARLPVAITLPKLSAQIKKDYGTSLDISYIDAEGDKVSIRTQEDLSLALKLQNKKEGKDESCPSLRLILESYEEKGGDISPLNITLNTMKRPPTGRRRGRRPMSSGLGTGAMQSPTRSLSRTGAVPVPESFAVADLYPLEESRPTEFNRYETQSFGQTGGQHGSTVEYSKSQGPVSVSPDGRKPGMSKTQTYIRSTPDLGNTRPLTSGQYTGMRMTATPSKFSNTTMVQPYGFMDTLESDDKTMDGPLLWQKGNLIGEGSFGKVYAALDLRSGRQLAVKQMKFSRGKESKAQVRMLQKEIALMEKLTHPNIILYLGTQQIGNKLNIFLEFASEGSLMHAIRRFGCFRESVIRPYCCQILDGLIYLHGQGIIHRDIKPSNILIDKGIVKLADFGCSIGIDLKDGDKSEAAHQYTAVGTTTYMAPEVMQADIESGAGYGRKADIWSVGMTVHEMATGKAPFPSAAVAIFKVCVKNDIPSPPETLSPEAHEFLELCFEFEPKTRPDATELRSHAFCSFSDDPSLLALPSCYSQDLEDSFSDDGSAIPPGESTEEASSRRMTKNAEDLQGQQSSVPEDIEVDPFLSESTSQAFHHAAAKFDQVSSLNERSGSKSPSPATSPSSVQFCDDKKGFFEEDLEDTFSDLEISMK